MTTPPTGGAPAHPTLTLGPVLHPASAPQPWWRHAVIYQIYPRSFADANGDGMGDLPGITDRLPELAELGVDGVWLSPFYPSPQVDAGYDVADYRDIDPLFGTLADFDALVERCHRLGLKVVVDLVPNHTSSRHAWFAEALAAAPGDPARQRYHFRDGTGPDGSRPPNNWRSVFGGPAWTRLPDGQWYLHLFDAAQPDLNWDHPQVRAEFEDILRFWCARGVDGFRVDVAHALVKAPGLPDWQDAPPADEDPVAGLTPPGAPMWDQPEVHDIYRSWRATVDSAGPGERMFIGEAWVESRSAWAAYLRPDELHLAFDFAFLEAPWSAPALRSAIAGSLAAAGSVAAPTTWVLSNHDVVRHTSRFGLPAGTHRPNGIAATDPQPDEALGLRRGRAATTLMLALPGAAYLYQGEELGLPEATRLPDEVRQDPTFARSGGREVGRDGCRVPLPWRADAWNYGFGPAGTPWLPQPESWARYARDRQQGMPDSTLTLYARLLHLRRSLRIGYASLAEVRGYGPQVLAYALATGEATDPADGDGRVLVLLNLGPEPVPLPEAAQVLVASGPLTSDGRLPTDTACWARW